MSTASRLLATAAVLPLLTACAGDGLSTSATGAAPTTSASAFSLSSVTGYQAANALMPQGHAVSGTNDPNTIRVTATGSAGTPAARLEQIALARAGEYGAEQRKKAFVAGPSSVTVRCGKKLASRRDDIPMAVTHYRVLTMDVTYVDAPNDPAARATAATADTMKAAIAAEGVPADVQSAAAAEVKAACPRA